LQGIGGCTNLLLLPLLLLLLLLPLLLLLLLLLVALSVTSCQAWCTYHSCCSHGLSWG
jgi:hypothetical protein